MPIYVYRCSDCSAEIEILHDFDQPSPKRCGFRCVLSTDSEKEYRGFGELHRQISTFHTVKRPHSDTVTAEQAAKVGLSTYENQGDGSFKKIAGQGPSTIRK